MCSFSHQLQIHMPGLLHSLFHYLPLSHAHFPFLFSLEDQDHHRSYRMITFQLWWLFSIFFGIFWPVLSHKTSACKCMQCYISHVLWPQICKYSNSLWKLSVMSFPLWQVKALQFLLLGELRYCLFNLCPWLHLHLLKEGLFGDGKSFSLFVLLFCLTETQFTGKEFI